MTSTAPIGVQLPGHRTPTRLGGGRSARYCRHRRAGSCESRLQSRSGRLRRLRRPLRGLRRQTFARRAPAKRQRALTRLWPGDYQHSDSEPGRLPAQWLGARATTSTVARTSDDCQHSDPGENRKNSGSDYGELRGRSRRLEEDITAWWLYWRTTKLIQVATPEDCQDSVVNWTPRGICAPNGYIGRLG